MVYLKKILPLLLFVGALIQVQAQDQFQFVSESESYSEYSAILLNGKPLADINSPNKALQLDPKATGKLSVFTLGSSSYWPVPKQAIGFKLGVKDAETNTLWMYAEETLFEVDLEDLLPQCEEGDRLIFMTVDPKFHLPHHEVLLGDGC